VGDCERTWDVHARRRRSDQSANAADAGERPPASFRHILDGLGTALRDVRQVVIPNASHSSTLGNPQAFERGAGLSCGTMMARERGVSSAGLRQSSACPFVAAVIGYS
jgi:hypothetical protein